MNSSLQLCLVVTMLCTTAALQAGAYTGPERFDFTHVDLAIQYHEAPSHDLLREIAGTPAAMHLERHSERTGYYPSTATALSITEDLVKNSPSPETLRAVSDLVDHARSNASKQRECMETAAAYLPGEAQPENALLVTWGYDIGVAMDAYASLNFAHPHFLEDHREVWFYCIHEVHHSGVMQVHPMPVIAGIDSVPELYEFVRYATFLEGLAVHAARDARSAANALENDSDYVALGDDAVLVEILAAYRERLSFLQMETDKPLGDSHWQVVEEMSSGQRLWYVAGAAMAASIEEKLGRGGLLKLTLEGPHAFFEAYAETRAQGTAPVPNESGELICH